MTEQTTADDPVLGRLRQELDRAYGNRLKQVVLYGSRARGDHRDDSDYDIAVFLDGFDDWYVEVSRIIELSFDALGDVAPLISPMVFRADRLAERTPIMHEIRKDGRPLA